MGISVMLAMAGILIATPVLASAADDAQGTRPVEVRVRAVPGDGKDDTQAVRAAREECRRHARPVLVFEPGRYDFHAGAIPEQGGTSIVVSGVHNLTIDGRGAQLVFHGLTGAFLFRECRNVTVRNLSIDWERPPFSTGVITAVAERSFDVRVFEEFPVQGGEPVQAFMDHDPATGLPVRGGMDVYHGVTSTELVEPQVLRVHTRNPVRLSPGSLAVLRHQVYSHNAFVFSHCENVRAQDITVYTAPGMGLVGARSRDVTLERFRVQIRPGTRRYLSTTADATHFSGCTGTITIRDCEFEGMGDDAVNIKSGLYLTIREIQGRDTALGQHNLKMQDPPNPGDVLEVAHTDDLLPYATVTVKSVEMLEDNVHRLVFQDRLPQGVRVGDVVGNATLVPRVRIFNCRVSRNRARGFLLQTRDVIVEGCHFKDITSGGIWVMTEVVYFHESIGTRNVIVRFNTFENCNYGGPPGESVLSVFAYLADFRFPPKPGVHRDITLQGNRIRGSDNCGILVAGTDGIRILNNTIEDVCRRPSRPEGTTAIYVTSTRNAVISGNTVLPDQQGEGFAEALRLGPGNETATIQIRGNRGF
ncbi:MAG: right-handed parallel beta-helix repeat-containing protein [Armatimonadota bacterium]